MPDDGSEHGGVGPAPAETVALWVKAVATMGPDELESFVERTYRQWDRASLGDLRRAIERKAARTCAMRRAVIGSSRSSPAT